MNKKLLILPVILIAFIVFSGGCFNRAVSQNVIEGDTGTVEDNSQAEITAEEPVAVDQGKYEATVKDLLKPYWQNGQISGIKDGLLALNTPSQYLDLHLGLVISLEMIEQGNSKSDQVKIAEGKDKLNGLAEKYSWIK